ncbi:hypothetical protein E4U28_008202 [Claviceps purpurea]|nr:hypothetical protein E4U28_008202 [Claviceps purpurea]
MLFRWFVVAERDAEQEVTRYSKTKYRASPRVPIAVLEDDFLYSVFLRRRVVLPILGCEIERLGDALWLSPVGQLAPRPRQRSKIRVTRSIHGMVEIEMDDEMDHGEDGRWDQG